jgi:cysteinyl-tRNA synthetase
MAIRFKNTLTRKEEDFIPQKSGEVKMYHCGPTVYDYPHIGNLRAYVFADVLRRTLEASGLSVKQVINITDVGHLVSDADEGEDKMEKGARREGKSVEEIIALYTGAFMDDLRALNIRTEGTIFPRASLHIPEQIAMIETLAKKGHTYRTSDGIYFDSSTFPQYGDFAHLDLAGLKKGARIGENEEKRHPYDFALWKFSGNEKRLQEWHSPLGMKEKGFPGWHIECSAMSQKYLGEQFDIHTGGIDHIPVHHTNEIAQSECATGKHPFVKYWMHSGFMTVEGEKMSKSLGNTYRLSDLMEKGISPAALRYWFLTAKYDTTINFTWDALEGAQRAIESLARELTDTQEGTVPNVAGEHLVHDLDTPRVLGLLSHSTKEEKLSVLTLLGIDLSPFIEKLRTPLPKEVISLIEERDQARREKDWTKSDQYREKITNMGYLVEDTSTGTRVTPQKF